MSDLQDILIFDKNNGSISEMGNFEGSLLRRKSCSMGLVQVAATQAVAANALY